MSESIKIISEIGHNHMGNIRLAKLMIEEAKNCGADIVKFQAYDTDKIKKPWQSRYMELKVSEPTFEDLKELKEHADKVGIEFMASAFDVERVGWLEKLGVKRHKLASRSIYDTELIKAMEATGKPIIASLGKWGRPSWPTIHNVTGKETDYNLVDFLFCVAEYPAYVTSDSFPITFKSKFGEEHYSGFSDHTEGCYWAREAIKRGATIIEKHFTLDKKLPGHDQKGSADPTELKDLVTYARQVERGITF